MGSGALGKLSEASGEEVSAVYKDLSPEAQANLKEALAALHKGNGLSLRSMISGSVTASLAASADTTYMDLVNALNAQVPETKNQVVKLFIPTEPMDPYKTLGEQGVDVKGEVQYTVAEFSVGTKLTQDEAAAIVESIIHGIDGLSKADVDEVKALKNPPKAVKTVVAAVAVLLQKPRGSWDDLRKMLTDQEFLPSLLSFEKDNVSTETLNELQWYLAHPDFQQERVKRVSAACVCLRDWVDCMHTFATTFQRLHMP
ncbi:unnamed protein product [Cladocopium goreaui]|uniref:Dynein heavy chain coiled coil stalk domain-containing protein n=1 Tax=Cladocopium goreaui TaxID=2562237 RepID=A0A9P1DTF4_9DINO|nr:unnamed protein product [Cladocopium goreaui]